ncbi:hypothetical protein TNIN_155061 [Trichonephila inaurata madagascariensis]|uniref:Uncharacterized protein n=1 Tax=Trichonephila inaurata madagascariensis TaxID=2747483 RepID=A0A8X6IXZ0_9ARAC|nr:hypothetical protein TNIN_155061 [Trichonephila inaurata madagascariensis]
MRVPGKTGTTLLRLHIYFVIQERLYYERLTRDVKGLVFLFDLSRRKSTLKEASLYLKQLEIEMEEDIMPPYIFVGNKKDKRLSKNRKYEKNEKAEKKALENYQASEYFECSAKVGIGCFPLAQYIIQNYTGERTFERSSEE